MLPGKSGVELCENLRARPRGDEMYILLVTARSDAEDLERALAAGANDYLTKPLDARRLSVRLSVAERHIQELEERNHARIALQESARRMTDILEKTSDGFFAVDTNWNFTYLNAEAEVMLGKPRASLIGQNIWEQIPKPDRFGLRAELSQGHATTRSRSNSRPVDAKGKGLVRSALLPEWRRRLCFLPRNHRAANGPRRDA